MQNKIITTEDGSHTIYVPSLDEHYHSTHGAINESMHVYINAGLRQCSSKEINLLEIGFGTGLNAFLSLSVALKSKLKINYYSIEKYPLSEEEYSKLNYSSHIFPEYTANFEQIHKAIWNTNTEICDNFLLKKIKADLRTFDYAGLPMFNLVYFDAFAPGKQPEMWSFEIFQKIFNHTKDEGILVTYCAKGSVRRMLNELGFMMERLPGPVGKKEILRGIKHL